MRKVSALALSLFAASAFASESWILDVPLRGIANQETGEVRMLMDLRPAPPGAQLVVNGATTINLGSSAMVNGDSVAFYAGSGHQVVIYYKPLSNFGADFCAGGAAVEKQIPMRFAGAQDIVSWRMSSYAVGGADAAGSRAPSDA